MKTFMPFLFLTSLFLITSCGGGKTSAKFEVTTSALSVANSIYGGGLVITGTASKTGEHFVYPIPANTGTGSSVTLELQKDEWTFSAVGWEGGTPFNGNSKCGATVVNLQNDVETVNLQIDYTKCATQEEYFGSNTFRNGNTFYPLKVATCGWLYESDGITPVSSTTPDSWCNTGSSVDAKYKNYAQSVLIEVPQDLNGKISAGISRCIASGSDGVFSTASHVPTKGIPFQMTLFNQPNCPTDPGTIIASYDFTKGIGEAYADHDSLLNRMSSTNRLFLPSYETKRGFSSLLANKPSILCNSLPCMDVPTSLPSGSNILVRSGADFVAAEIPVANQTCDNLVSIVPTSITPVPTLAEIKQGCSTKDGKLLIRLNFTSLSVSPSLQLNFSSAPSITRTLETSSFYDAHAFAWENIGYPLSATLNPPIKNSFSAFFEDHSEAGLLSEVREMMGPEGAGGVLGGGLNCVTDTSVNFVTFQEDGVKKTYKIELLNGGNSRTIGSYLADGVVLAANYFDKKILISRKVGTSSYVAEMVIDFDCTENVGRMESRHIKSDGREKRIVEWNTRSSSASRVKEYRYEDKSDSNGILRIETSYAFVETPASDPLRARARKWSLDINFEGGAYKYYARTSQIEVKNGITGFRFLEATPGTAPTAATSNDTAYVSALATAIGIPTAQCVSKTAFSSDTCGVLPTTFSGSIYDGAFSPSQLDPSSIYGLFTAF